MRIYNKSFLGIFVLLLCITNNTVLAEQNVYLAESLDVIKKMRTLKKRGKPLEGIVSKLMTQQKLEKMTPQLAMRKFKIRWKKSEFGIRYPSVVICYIGSDVGYGLFTMENIKKNKPIVEYTGKYGRNYDSSNENKHAIITASINQYIQKIQEKSNGSNSIQLSFDTCINTKTEGNASRFVKRFMTEDEITKFGYHYVTPGRGSLLNDIATANSKLVILYPNGDTQMFEGWQYMPVILYATEDIKEFEQIGYHYSHMHGYKCLSSPWQDEPHVFNKQGEVIPRDKYDIDYFEISFNHFDGDISSAMFTKDELINLIAKTKADYFPIALSLNDKYFHCMSNAEVLRKNFLAKKHRIALLAYDYDPDKALIVDQSLNLYSEVWKKIECCMLSKKEISTIIKVVNSSTEAAQLKNVLDHLAHKEEVNVHDGLQGYPINGNGDCLYEAVAYYLTGIETNIGYLRDMVAENLENESEEYRGFVPLRTGQTLQEYIEGIRTTYQWADNVEINILMRLLNRPIVVIGPDGTIINIGEVRQYIDAGDPIFVYYNGANHYNVLILRYGYDDRGVLHDLVTRTEQHNQELQTTTLQPGLASQEVLSEQPSITLLQMARSNQI